MNKKLEAKLRELAEHGDFTIHDGSESRISTDITRDQLKALAKAVLELSDWQIGSLKVLRDLAAALGVKETP